MTLDADTSVANNGFSLAFGNASVSGNFEVSNIASVSQLYIAGSAWGWPLEAPAGSVTSPSYGFDGADGMGMLRSSTTLLLQSKDTAPSLAGRSRLSHRICFAGRHSPVLRRRGLGSHLPV
jgi:hypothetical protein